MLTFVMSTKGTPSCALSAGGALDLGTLELLKVEWDEDQQDHYVTFGFTMPADIMVIQLPSGSAEKLYLAAQPFMFLNMSEEQQARVMAAQETHECPCGAAFTSRDALRNHMIDDHSDEDD